MQNSGGGAPGRRQAFEDSSSSSNSTFESNCSNENKSVVNRECLVGAARIRQEVHRRNISTTSSRKSNVSNNNLKPLPPRAVVHPVRERDLERAPELRTNLSSTSERKSAVVHQKFSARCPGPLLRPLVRHGFVNGEDPNTPRHSVWPPSYLFKPIAKPANDRSGIAVPVAQTGLGIYVPTSSLGLDALPRICDGPVLLPPPPSSVTGSSPFAVGAAAAAAPFPSKDYLHSVSNSSGLPLSSTTSWSGIQNQIQNRSSSIVDIMQQPNNYTNPHYSGQQQQQFYQQQQQFYQQQQQQQQQQQHFYQQQQQQFYQQHCQQQQQQQRQWNMRQLKQQHRQNVTPASHRVQKQQRPHVNYPHYPHLQQDPSSYLQKQQSSQATTIASSSSAAASFRQQERGQRSTSEVAGASLMYKDVDKSPDLISIKRVPCYGRSLTHSIA